MVEILFKKHDQWVEAFLAAKRATPGERIFIADPDYGDVVIELVMQPKISNENALRELAGLNSSVDDIDPEITDRWSTSSIDPLGLGPLSKRDKKQLKNSQYKKDPSCLSLKYWRGRFQK